MLMVVTNRQKRKGIDPLWMEVLTGDYYYCLGIELLCLEWTPSPFLIDCNLSAKSEWNRFIHSWTVDGKFEWNWITVSEWGMWWGMSECGWMSRQNATGLSNGRILLHIIWIGERMENSNPLPLRMRKRRDTWSAFSQGLGWVSGNSKALDKYDTITTRGQCDMKGRRGRQLCVLFDQTAAASDAPPRQEYDDMVTHSHGFNGIAN